MEQIFYPKQLLEKKQRRIENQCFFAMPFSAEFTNLYQMISIYLNSENYKPIRVDENSEGGIPIISLILTGIAQSQYVIVDISEPNANVFYELGIAQTLKEANNIFIIKEKSSATPFDIQHLQYIAYDKNNIKNLAEQLIKRLKADQYRNEFWNELYKNNIIDDKYLDEFTSYCFEIFSKEDITNYTEILKTNGNKTFLLENEKKSFFHFDDIMRKETYKTQNDNNINMLDKLLNKLVINCCFDISVSNYVDEFLHLKNYGNIRIEKLYVFQTEMAIDLALNSKLQDISMTWIINYFQKSKSTNVDLNRYKLESFLLKTNEDFVIEYIVNAILSNDRHIREHMADIAGEKHLMIAEDNLIIQLQREENIYTMASLVEALGKIKSKKSASIIFNWINMKADSLIANENYFVLKHTRNALLNIKESNYLQLFDEKYYDILIRNNALSSNC